MRIVFMGTPDFAVPTLVELASRGHEIVAVYTRAPAPAGRGMDDRRSPVHETAARFGIPVLHPASLKGEEAAEIFRARPVRGSDSAAPATQSSHPDCGSMERNRTVATVDAQSSYAVFALCSTNQSNY